MRHILKFSNVEQKRGQKHWVRCAITCLIYWAIVPPTSALGDTKDYTVEKEPRKIALVIGNENYKHMSHLASARTDAEKMAEQLKVLKFDVLCYFDVPLFEFYERVLPEFRSKLTRGDLVVFYFSGHGFSHGPDGFLAPTDLPLSINEDNVSEYAISVDAFEGLIASHSPGLVLFLLDSCRSIGAFEIKPKKGAREPFAAKGTLPPPPRENKRGVNSLVGYATQPGQIALAVTESGRLSIFTEGLVRHIGKEGELFGSVMDELSAEVKSLTNKTQIPWVQDSSQTDPYLNPTEKNFEEQRQAWASVLEKQIYRRIEVFSFRYSVSRHAAAAREWLADNVDKKEASNFTLASPSAIDRAWRPANASRVGVRRLSLPFAFDRSLDQGQAAELRKFSDPEIGLVASGTSVQRINQMETGGRFFTLGTTSTVSREEFSRNSLAFSLANIEGHQKVVATDDFVGRLAPDSSAPPVKLVRFGTRLEINGVTLGPGESVWVSASTPGDTEPFYLKVEPGTSPLPLELGQSVKEIVVLPRPNSVPELVDPLPIEKALADLKGDAWTITWVSLATAPTDDEWERETRFARIANAEYLIKRAGIDGRRVTSVSGREDFTGNGVRIRFFGIK